MQTHAATEFAISTHNGTITVSNPNSGNHRTFKIRTQKLDAKFAPGKRIVSLLTGEDNGSDYTSFGFVSDTGKISLWRKFYDTKYEKLAELLEYPDRAIALWGMEYQWAAKCRVCNHELTDPISISLGIGPTCRGGR